MGPGRVMKLLGREYSYSQLSLGLDGGGKGGSRTIQRVAGPSCCAGAKQNLSAQQPATGPGRCALRRGVGRWFTLSLAFYALLSASHCQTPGSARENSTIQLLATK